MSREGAAQAVESAFSPLHQTLQLTQATQVHQGPIPHPDILAGYDKIVPGAANRILVLAETEALNRNRREDDALQANIRAQDRQLEIAERQTKSVFKSDLVGQVFGFFVCLGCIGAAVYLGVLGHDWLAGALAAIPTGAIVKAFFAEKPKPAK